MNRAASFADVTQDWLDVVALGACRRRSIRRPNAPIAFLKQIERLTPEIARYNLDGSYGAYEPSFNASAGERFLNQPGTFDPKKSGVDAPYELTTDSLGLGIAGLLPSGLSFDAEATASFLSARTDFSLSPKDAVLFPPNCIRDTNQYFSITAVTLRQPLLRDFWIDAYRQKIRVNKKNLKISEMALRWKIMNTINAVQQTYYEVVFAREKIRVEEKALELANQLLKQTRKRVEVGDLPPLDEKQAEAQVQTVQSDLYAAEQALAEQQNALKNLTTDEFQTWVDVTVEPSEGLIAVPQMFDRSDSWRNAIGSRPDLVQSRAGTTRWAKRWETSAIRATRSTLTASSSAFRWAATGPRATATRPAGPRNNRPRSN